MVSNEIVLVGILLVVVVLLTLFRRRATLPIEHFTSAIAYKKPTLWWVVDSEINARQWWDFGARNSEEPNRGYLQLALEAVKRTQGRDFSIVVLLGRDAVLKHLPMANPAAKQLPAFLWRLWAMSNLLATSGGLFLDGNSTLCIGPAIYPYVRKSTSALFDSSHIPGLAEPSPYIAWAQSAHNSAWDYASSVYNNLVNKGPSGWSSAVARNAHLAVWKHMVDVGLDVVKIPDGGKLPNGKPRHLEDLFGRVGNNDSRIAVAEGVIFVPYDGDELSRRYEFNWFLRLSKQQLLDSEIVWTKLLG